MEHPPIRLTVFATVLFALVPNVQAQFTITDAAFAEGLQYWVPAAMNGNVLDTLHPDVINTTNLAFYAVPIANIDGIRYFTNLQTLSLEIHALTELPPLPLGLTGLGVSYGPLTSLPPLPAGLERLTCNNNQLTSLGELPPTLVELWCEANLITSLPALPAPLWRLYCAQNQLTSLPALPSGLEVLECNNNAITSLPALPPSLTYLRCGYNSLSTLPALPNGISTVDCHDNPLTTLPALPVSLANLYCGNASLTALPALNDSLRVLSCYGNPLTALPTLSLGLRYLSCYGSGLSTLPDLPASLESLACYDNAIGCLPWLPNSLQTLRCYNNPLSCLPNIPTNFNAPNSILGFPVNVCNLNTAPCAINDEAVSGSVFIDANMNGTKDPGEGPFRYTYVRALPGAYITAPDGAGRFAMPLDPGTFTVDADAVPYHTRTTPAFTVELATLEVDTGLHMGYWPMPGVHDLRVDLSSWFAIRGQDNAVWLTVENPGTETEDALIDFGFESGQTWVGSTVAPDVLSGQTAQWQVQLAPGARWQTTIGMHTQPATLPATPIPYSLSAYGTAQDTTPQNNLSVFYHEVLASCDPNDKSVAPASIAPGDTLPDGGLEYLVRFQNTGTAPAFRVVITDTLSALLDASTLRVVSSSHPQHWFLQQGVLHFVFDPILLADSTADEVNSHGFVKFRIQPHPGLVLGDHIDNVANIYFDFNEPVITAPAIFSVELPSGITNASTRTDPRVWPVPSNGNVQIANPSDIDRIEVLSMDGRLLRQFRGIGKYMQLDLRDLPRGVLLLRVMSGAEMHTHRLVLQ